jgi:diaminohydroxyphosphoribosylaminopyrimidine deaminase/5-amino-6-(5-phosphoribosylamino)uracil reductase
MVDPDFDTLYMTRALELAARGQGFVEPNPMVGCVIVRDGEVVGEGWHRRYGQAHAEIEALTVAGPHAAGATMYVTLEPCCHFGKTPPCSKAVIAAGLRRVVIAQEDPFCEVGGRGIAELGSAGIDVEVGICGSQAHELNAPYEKLMRTGRPWIIAKWAMTLDGKIATRNGDSKWISSPSSREIVHAIRGRVDAVIVGRGTVAVDDPMLTARPAGARTATRILLDTGASVPLGSQLVRSARAAPVLVVVGPQADEAQCQQLEDAGCELLRCREQTPKARLDEVLSELGRRRMTNVLVEGGGQVLGSLFDAGEIDEVHVFVAPRLIGGDDAPTPIAGDGLGRMSQSLGIDQPRWQQIGEDLYLHGRVRRETTPGLANGSRYE